MGTLNSRHHGYQLIQFILPITCERLFFYRDLAFFELVAIWILGALYETTGAWYPTCISYGGIHSS